MLELFYGIIEKQQGVILVIDWEMRYRSEGAIWTYEPSATAETAARWLRENEKQGVYIIGIGYGRNVAPFLKYQLSVSGIDVSETACSIGRNHFGRVAFDIGAYEHTEIPKQEAIYCFDVLHCLETETQVAFIKKMYNDLEKDGIAYITVLSDVAQLSDESKKGRTLFSENDITELCRYAPFQIEAITPHTDLFHYQDKTVKQYPLLCVKLRK